LNLAVLGQTLIYIKVGGDAIDSLLLSVVRLCRAAIPHMRARGGGRIINITSISVKQPIQGLVLSNSLRAAVTALAKTLAAELAPDGILVNTVSPGFSDASTVVGQTPQEWQDAMAQWVESGWTPMRRRSRPEDIADVCALLCSDEARFVTGQAIAVDGGASLMNAHFPLALQVPA